MDRRRFLALAAAAPLVVAAAHYLPTRYGAGLNDRDPTACSLEWSGSREYKLGDIIVVSGFSSPKYNGTWRVVGNNSLERC